MKSIKADQDRRQSRAARSLCHVPACRGRGSTAAVSGNPATDRRPAAEASADMTPRVTAPGLNRRGPGARRLPSNNHLASDCDFAGSDWPECPITGRQSGSNGQPFDQYAIMLPFPALGLSQLGNLRSSQAFPYIYNTFCVIHMDVSIIPFSIGRLQLLMQQFFLEI